MTISMSKKYQTRDGRAVRLISDKGPIDYPFVGVITYSNGTEAVFNWTASGSMADREDRTDLIEVVPDVVIFNNIYPDETGQTDYGDLVEANDGASVRRIAILRTTIRNGGKSHTDVTVEVLPVDYQEPTP